jgi:predicted DNA-binding transcriptional regulator AlpA
VNRFILDPWEDDLEHLSLKEIAELEGVDQRTILRLVGQRRFPKPDGGRKAPWWLSHSYRRFQAARSRPGSASASTPRGHAALLKVWQEYWSVNAGEDVQASVVESSRDNQ